MPKTVPLVGSVPVVRACATLFCPMRRPELNKPGSHADCVALVLCALVCSNA